MTLRAASVSNACVGLLLGFAVACGSSGGSGFNTDAGADGSLDATRRVDGGATRDALVLSADSPTEHVTGLAIDPASSTLTVTSLSSLPTSTLTAVATFANHTTAHVAASWSLDRLDIASVGAGSGIVTVSGTTFGLVHVTATAAGLTAHATVSVVLDAKSNPANLPSATLTALDGATTSDPAVTAFAYPYDKTVFPEGLQPPVQMWNGGAAGDAYSLEYVAPSFDLTVYFDATPPSQFTLPAAQWTALTSTAGGSDVTVTLHRANAGGAYVSATETWHIADANLGGTIYYWAISDGQIEKIDLLTGTHSVVFDSGPQDVLGTPVPIDSANPIPVADGGPWENNGAGKRCVACHSVSKDGSTLTSVFSRAGSTGPLGFVDIAASSISAIGDYEVSGVYNALTPDGSQAVLNSATKGMQLLASGTGAPIASALDSQSNVCDPSFSPDGTKLALATDCDPGFGWPIEFRTSNLSFFSYTNAAPYFSGLTTILTSTGLGDAIAFPSFSPDSSFLFFQRGSYSRAKYGTNQHGIDDLYVVGAAAGETPIALAQANNPNGVLPADSQHLNYAPTVNPISAGGYIWVVFTSPRDYGNIMVSPQGAPPMDATYANHKQLWVTAVDANIGTVDPSHPPFWLPGQDPTTANMFGYWALSPCLPTAGDAGAASSCAAGFDCCSGFCRDQGAGPVCVASGSGCAEVGEKCTTAADCCSASGVGCVAGICQATLPK